MSSLLAVFAVCPKILFRVQSARARCPLVQTAQGTRFLGRLRGSYVAAFVCRLHAHGRCLVQTAHGTRFWADYVASTWHRRGNCRSLNVVQLQASTRLKTVSRERAHRLTPKRSLDTLRANCTNSYFQEVTSLFPEGGFLHMMSTTSASQVA